MKTFRFKLLALLLLVWSSFVSSDETVDALEAQTKTAEIVWVEPERVNYRVMLAKYDGEGWLEPEVVYKSDNALSSPAIATDQQGHKTLIVSELFEPAKSRLLIMRKPNNKRWSEPTVFSDYGLENLGVSILIDLSNTTWVFWSANRGKLDDIFVVKSQAGLWSDPQQVNTPNEVPDFQPQPMLNPDGAVKLQWKTFDFSTNQYVTVDHTFALDNSKKTAYKALLSEHQDINLADISLPSHGTNDARTVVHFPNNRRVQSLRLGQGR